MIYRLSFTSGHALPIEKSADKEEIDKVITANHHRLQSCLPGTYDLTPVVWKKNNYRWVLHVGILLDGFLLAIPKYDDVAMIPLKNLDTWKVYPGQHKLPLAKPGNQVAIAGPGDDGSNVLLFELLLYSPVPIK